MKATRPCPSIFGVLLFPLCLMLITAVPLAATVPSIDTVCFEQVDWIGPDGNVLETDSLFGRMKYSYVPTDTTCYLNLVASSTTSGSPAWVVQNLPLFASSSTLVRDEAVHIDLAELGVVAGQDLTQLCYLLEVEVNPRTDAPGGTLVQSAVMDEENDSWDHEESSTHISDDTAVQPPNGYKAKGESENLQCSKDELDAIPEERRLKAEGCKKCFAGAYARSFDYLNRQFELGLDKTTSQIYEDLIDLDVSKKPGIPCPPASRKTWLETSLSYFNGLIEAQNKKIVTRVWEIGSKIAGRNLSPRKYKDGQVPPIAGAESETLGKDKLKEWIKAEVRRKAAIQLAYTKTGGSGHIVYVLGCYEDEDGKLFVRFRDDNRQDNDKKGDCEIKVAEIRCLKEAREPTFRHKGNAKIIYAISTALPPPAEVKTKTRGAPRYPSDEGSKTTKARRKCDTDREDCESTDEGSTTDDFIHATVVVDNNTQLPSPLDLIIEADASALNPQLGSRDVTQAFRMVGGGPRIMNPMVFPPGRTALRLELRAPVPSGLLSSLPVNLPFKMSLKDPNDPGVTFHCATDTVGLRPNVGHEDDDEACFFPRVQNPTLTGDAMMVRIPAIDAPKLGNEWRISGLEFVGGDLGGSSLPGLDALQLRVEDPILPSSPDLSPRGLLRWVGSIGDPGNADGISVGPPATTVSVDITDYKVTPTLPHEAPNLWVMAYLNPGDSAQIFTAIGSDGTTETLVGNSYVLPSFVNPAINIPDFNFQIRSLWDGPPSRSRERAPIQRRTRRQEAISGMLLFYR